ncbi:MAG: hypothetical protein HGA36_01340 [Candidatus Moranbacteria bacterium]|nr:hypothetical protein [Candidatus Moranbacteria bacterium]
MTKFSEDIIGKIKCDHIAPVPRWHFLFKRCCFWMLFAISMILGSISFSVIVHVLKSGDFDIVHHLQGNLATSTVMLLPYFWLLFLILFAAIAYTNWKCTKLGYCFKRRWIVFGSFALSIFLGSILYVLGMGKYIDRMMTRSMPFYNQSKHDALREMWLHPENGFLTGKIVEINEETEELVVIDEEGRKWIVDDDGIYWENVELEKRGKIVKVIGSREGESNFKAREIRRCGNCEDDEE